MTADNWVDLIGIVVNGLLALWVVNNIQKKQSDDRSIKDHFFTEITELRSTYSKFLNNIFQGKVLIEEVIPSLRLVGIKSSRLANVLNFTMNIDKDFLNPMIIELNTIISEDLFFQSNLNNPDVYFLPTSTTKERLLRFQGDHQFRFTDLILTTNSSKIKQLK